AGCSAAMLASPAVGASAQAAGIDAICIAQATIALSPALGSDPLNTTPVAAAATGAVSNCIFSGAVTSAALSTTSPLTATGCFPLFSLTGNTVQLAWNDSTTSTLSLGVNFNPLTGLVSLAVTVIAGKFAGDTVTPVPLVAG